MLRKKAPLIKLPEGLRDSMIRRMKNILAQRMFQFIDEHRSDNCATRYYAGGPAQLALMEGRYWPKLEGEPGYIPWLGGQRTCFANAFVYAAKQGLRYIEGYALAPDGNVFLHGWCSNSFGHLLEVTWPVLGSIYLGVEFSIERADDSLWNGEASVLDDSRGCWSILRERWRGEPEGLEWPPSARLALIKNPPPEDISHEELLRLAEGGALDGSNS